ncbi:hypothetical protein AUJ42_02900 [Candidatus Collierbacteria bacterium CG1_02_44_10]|uniref:DUF2433 domain-containing protein n=1 Tax=Candidatus Collierbacteria bacterium CG1_02_44_10 TaxID=1805087 RepID=A0A1J4RUL3_9BACT|nr:MAG: hypothetical protein AUJ42_02900 [Candidatus Collierbacteria bacterium CG1_02_44_10]
MTSIEAFRTKINNDKEKFKGVWERVAAEVKNLILKEKKIVDKEAALQLLDSADFKQEATKIWGDPYLATSDDEKILAQGVLIRLKQKLDN